MSNTVKYFHSDLAGAPVLNGTAGSMISLLDACLVNGWGTGTVDSIVISGGVATVTRGAGHPFEPDMVTEISGASVSGGSINGQHKILSVVGNTYTFSAAGIGDQTATGTINHKIASLGFTKPYTGTNLAAYRSGDVTGTQFYLRVDDTGAQDARVRAHETMSSISDDTLRFPTEAQSAGGYWWKKSNASDSAARRWVLFGNGKTFYLAINWTSNTQSNLGLIAAFGDFLPVGSADAHRCFISGSTTSSLTTPGANNVEFDYSINSASSCVIARSFTGIGSPVTTFRAYPTMTVAGAEFRSGDASSDNNIQFPNGPDGGLYAAPHYIGQSVGRVFRGRSPGFYPLPQKIGNAVFAHREKVSSVSGLPGRKLMVLNSNIGCFGFDITGPWE